MEDDLTKNLKMEDDLEKNENGSCFYLNYDYVLKKMEDYLKNSASADGGPLSRVCTRETLSSAPHQHLRKL